MTGAWDDLTGVWDDFAVALSAELARLPLDAVMIIAERGRPEHFTQVLQTPDHLRAEVAGEVVDDQAGLLTVRDERLLGAIGWHPPRPEDGDANWWQHVPWPANTQEYRQLAEAMVTSLRDVNEVPAPADLVYRSWEASGARRLLRLPGLEPDDTDPHRQSYPTSAGYI